MFLNLGKPSVCFLLMMLLLMLARRMLIILPAHHPFDRGRKSVSRAHKRADMRLTPRFLYGTAVQRRPVSVDHIGEPFGHVWDSLPVIPAESAMHALQLASLIPSVCNKFQND